MRKHAKRAKSLIYQKLNQFRNHLKKVVSESLRPEGAGVRTTLAPQTRVLESLLASRRRMCSSYGLPARKSGVALEASP